MKVTNNHVGDLTLPDGTSIRPKGEIEIKDDLAAEIVKNPVVAAWIDEGIIAFGEPEKPAPKKGKGEADRAES